MTEVHNPEWNRLEQRMKYHQATTEQLLELWLADRLQEQAKAHLPSPYGSILLRLIRLLGFSLNFQTSAIFKQ